MEHFVPGSLISPEGIVKFRGDAGFISFCLEDYWMNGSSQGRRQCFLDMEVARNRPAWGLGRRL